MIAANVLCLKKKKKRTYSLSSCKGDGAGTSKNDSSRNDRVTMIPITEDTPPDMLAGAMDLTVHLPSGKSVKMSVERSTPMMDLLVQVTTTNHLQLSNHTLQVLGMAPSSEHNDKVLLFKPNTPIGTLDTQHIRVLPKERTLPAPKYSAPGHQPFESTFRLKVHLPRNQLYVTRVSRNVLLEDIMKKVCGEKNLDPTKYDFKHPGNLDQILDPKFTLSDYQITEIYVVAKGTTNLNQAFSAADIMVLRKEEERKQMHNKAGGGVFNLIFKRGKSSMGSGSVSSDNRSISPTQSDDSRSVTPPVVQPPPERPKPPQRKRRPAPKPPQAPEASSTKKTIDNGLTICHSRNSSDSSGYHEASILSDHCANASLPRMRPKSAFVGDLVTAQGSSNLNTMVPHSRSTTSLVTGRKKKAAPPPPPPAAISPASSVVTQSANPSPLVASQSDNSAQSEFSVVLDITENPSTNPVPIPKPRTKVSRAKSNLQSPTTISIDRPENAGELTHEEASEPAPSSASEVSRLELGDTESNQPEAKSPAAKESRLNFRLETPELFPINSMPKNDYSMEEILTSLEAVKPFIMNTDKSPKRALADLQLMGSILDESSKDPKPPAIVGVIPKTPKLEKRLPANSDSFGKRRCFQIGKSLEQKFNPETASLNSKSSRGSASFEDEISDLDENMFAGSLSKASTRKRPEVFNQLFGIHSFEGRLPFNSNSPDQIGIRNQPAGAPEPESATSATLPLEQTPRDSPPLPLQQQEKSLDSADSGTRLSGKGDREEGFQTPPPPPLLDEIEADAPPLPVTPPPQLIKLEAELVDVDWQYQLPSPPGAFRDSSPVPIVGPESDFKDSVVTSPELFEKLKSLEESQSVRSETSEEPLNTLTLEHLEKRKSLVYNRELATSLKMTDSLESSAKSSEAFASSRGGFQIDPDKPKHPPKPARSQSQHYTLPNFKISTYDVPKHQNIKVFEDDTIRSSTHLGKTHLEESVWKRHSVDEAPKEHATQASAVSRSGSFSSDSRTPLKPVSRSKSTLTLNKYQAGRKEAGTNMSRSNSLFDVSGLQSLEVMKLIQNKLNTPPGSQEQLPREEPHDDTHASPKPVRKFYRGPPAVNMSTWSERPKVPVAVKADEDYKLGNASKPQEEHGGAEITQKSGNVVIRIGANKSSLLGPAGYRRPLANLNGSTRPVQRPHSIALDLSRVPVVRSMELKKPFQEAQTGNTSITHLNQDQEEFKSLQSHYGENDPDRRVFRAGSFRPVDVQGAPVVRGFKSGSIEINNRLSWNPSMTLPARSQMDKGFNTNQFVPFSQSVLRRTESSKRYIPDPKPVGSCTSLPPPPPEMPRVVLRRAAPQERNQISPSDPRDQLLESIRNFGGKKGLRAAKV
ncbi:uncharacterized protein LOC109536057 isoform X1 [Dendroctonus ponderosae]|nr:uncharacterized protein LOC109536057 isoform X1 [Dendroctonus ponderosae]